MIFHLQKQTAVSDMFLGSYQVPPERHLISRPITQVYSTTQRNVFLWKALQLLHFPAGFVAAIFLQNLYLFHSQMLQMLLDMLIKQKLASKVCYRNNVLMVDEILGRHLLIKYKVKLKKKKKRTHSDSNKDLLFIVRKSHHSQNNK